MNLEPIVANAIVERIDELTEDGVWIARILNDVELDDTLDNRNKVAKLVRQFSDEIAEHFV